MAQPKGYNINVMKLLRFKRSCWIKVTKKDQKPNNNVFLSTRTWIWCIKDDLSFERTSLTKRNDKKGDRVLIITHLSSLNNLVSFSHIVIFLSRSWNLLLTSCPSSFFYDHMYSFHAYIISIPTYAYLR